LVAKSFSTPFRAVKNGSAQWYVSGLAEMVIRFITPAAAEPFKLAVLYAVGCDFDNWNL